MSGVQCEVCSVKYAVCFFSSSSSSEQSAIISSVPFVFSADYIDSLKLTDYEFLCFIFEKSYKKNINLNAFLNSQTY